MIEKGANDWDYLSNIENLELYKLYIQKTGDFNEKHYNKLICFYDSIYCIVTHYNNNESLKKLPFELWRYTKSF